MPSLHNDHSTGTSGRGEQVIRAYRRWFIVFFSQPSVKTVRNTQLARRVGLLIEIQQRLRGEMQGRDHDSFESTQTEYSTALEVSCLNSVYLRLGGGGGVCREEGLLAGACDGVEDRAGCHNSLGRVPLK